MTQYAHGDTQARAVPMHLFYIAFFIDSPGWEPGAIIKR
jgi:hypothetical protein